MYEVNNVLGYCIGYQTMRKWRIVNPKQNSITIIEKHFDYFYIWRYGKHILQCLHYKTCISITLLSKKFWWLPKNVCHFTSRNIKDNVGIIICIIINLNFCTFCNIPWFLVLNIIMQKFVLFPPSCTRKIYLWDGAMHKIFKSHIFSFVSRFLPKQWFAYCQQIFISSSPHSKNDCRIVIGKVEKQI